MQQVIDPKEASARRQAIAEVIARSLTKQATQRRLTTDSFDPHLRLSGTRHSGKNHFNIPSYIMSVMFPDWMQGLSPRARRCLLVGDYTTRIDVVVATAEDLLTVRGLGVKTLRELNEWRRPSTKDECARVAAWLQTKQASLLLTRRGSELCRAVLLADASNEDANQLRFGVLETLYPTIKRRA